MAFNNYTGLLAEIAIWLDRSDLTAKIPQFVALAEADLRVVLLQSRYITERTTINTTANSCTIALPALVGRVLSASINGSVLIRAQSSTMPCQASGKATPQFWGMEGIDKIRLYPMADAVYPVDVAYIPEIAPLSVTPTNWLLTKMPNVYLYGSLVAAKDYLQDGGFAQVLSLYQRAVSQLIETDVTTMPAIMQQTNLGG